MIGRSHPCGRYLRLSMDERPAILETGSLAHGPGLRYRLFDRLRQRGQSAARSCRLAAAGNGVAPLAGSQPGTIVRLSVHRGAGAFRGRHSPGNCPGPLDRPPPGMDASLPADCGIPRDPVRHRLESDVAPRCRWRPQCRSFQPAASNGELAGRLESRIERWGIRQGVAATPAILFRPGRALAHAADLDRPFAAGLGERARHGPRISPGSSSLHKPGGPPNAFQPESAASLFNSLLERARALPGVRDAALSSVVFGHVPGACASASALQTPRKVSRALVDSNYR